MILTSTTETVPFTPAWRKAEASPPVFHLRAGSVIERAQMEAELSGEHGAARVLSFELHEAALAGVQNLLADDPGLGRVTELLAREAVAGEPGAEPISGDDARLLVEVRKVLSEHWPDYRDLLAQANRRREIGPIVALRRFCVGWENCRDIDGGEAKFARGLDGRVTEAALAALPPIDMTAAGNRAYLLQYGANGEEKNSARPSSSDDGRKTSHTDDTSKAGGKSKGRSGRRTPASRSRPGSGQSSTSGS